MAILHQGNVAIFDDSFQPTGEFESKDDGPFGLPVPHAKWKKLRHTLAFTIEGPEDLTAAAEDCLKKAAVAGAFAAIVAAFTTGGIGAVSALWQAFEATFLACAGEQVSTRIDDHSEWLYWLS